jgi:uncharacterized protein YjlB
MKARSREGFIGVDDANVRNSGDYKLVGAFPSGWRDLLRSAAQNLERFPA